MGRLSVSGMELNRSPQKWAQYVSLFVCLDLGNFDQSYYIVPIPFSCTILD